MRCAGVGALALATGLTLGCGAGSADTGGLESSSTTEDRRAATELDDDRSGSPTDDEPEETSTSTTEPAPVELGGIVVSAEDRTPIAGAVVTAGDRTVTTDTRGRFTLPAGDETELLVRRPTYLPATIEASTAAGGDPVIPLQPVLARGVRVSRDVAADPARYRGLLDQIEATAVNALVFDTKDETGEVLYRTEVETARQVDAVRPMYRPEELLAQAAERGLYPITRVVTFEDRIWSAADPEAKLAGAWVDATDEANWEYPLALAEEACRLGFAEIQFDYVRYPAGRTAEVAAARVPRTADERSAVIAAFLAEARSRLEPRGCGTSAAIFGIVMSSDTDEGIGQTVEAVSAQVDAISPMLYPSHYGPGWLGFADPNDHPGPVIADAIDQGTPRLAEPIQMRPWIQAFYYNGAQIGAQITEAESRGAGWLLWNASGNYRDDWLPAAGRGDG